MKKNAGKDLTWKTKLGKKIAPELGREIDIFEMQLELRKQGKLDERVFAEARLRRGVYGQRYDDGRRHDGNARTDIAYSTLITKGPATLWDAPGMQRIKLPWGGLTADQLDAIAEVAEEYADGILHVTTRQDVQLHFVHVEDTPDLMRRLAAVGVSTREACGNSVRNVSACPLSGVCASEAFDVTPYAEALARYLLGHEDVQAFGRKFKISFSGCAPQACGLARMHDIGLIARVREADQKRGFTVYVGGGLGAVPHEAKLFSDFLEEEELLPTCQAICRVFARLGEKKNRGRARLKFLVEKLGIDELRRLVLEERGKLLFDPRWTSYLARIRDRSAQGEPVRATDPLVHIRRASTDAFDRWKRTNVRAQKQAGYVVVTVSLPLGDLSAEQARKLADVARRYVGDHLRATVDQNMVLRWVREADVRAIYDELAAIGLGEAGAGTIRDIVSCPGTDTCRLGISSSRGLAQALREHFAANEHAAVEELRIKVSGCFNSCAHHQLADLGFYGVSRKHGEEVVPCFQVVLGGESRNNAGAFGLAIGAVPAKHIPKVVERLTEMFARDRSALESFRAFVDRVGKSVFRTVLADLMLVPNDPAFFYDFGETRKFSLEDLRSGEGAGQSLPPVALGLAQAETELFEATLLLERREAGAARDAAYRAMLTAAKTLVKTEVSDGLEHAPAIVAEFKARFFDTERFFDPSARGRFAIYFFRAHEAQVSGEKKTPALDEARRRVEEARLFIEAAYACWVLTTNP